MDMYPEIELNLMEGHPWHIQRSWELLSRCWRATRLQWAAAPSCMNHIFARFVEAYLSRDRIVRVLRIVDKTHYVIEVVNNTVQWKLILSALIFYLVEIFNRSQMVVVQVNNNVPRESSIIRKKYRIKMVILCHCVE